MPKTTSLADLLVGWLETHQALQIILVVGNHEFYHHPNMPAAEDRLKDLAKTQTRLHVLQCDSVVIAGVRFLGCTSWPTFESVPPADRELSARLAAECINDFRLIGMRNNKRFTVADCIELGNQQRAWLDSELQNDFSGKTVVVTHFPPSVSLFNPRYPVAGNLLTGYFLGANQDLIDRYQPDVWVFGHTHANHDTLSGKTRLLSNQKGYGQECQSSYDPHNRIDLSDPAGETL
jgi:Icc-related predicted phosphoesterase